MERLKHIKCDLEDLVYKDFLGKLKSMIFHYGANEYIPYAVVTDYGSIDKFHQMDLKRFCPKVIRSLPVIT